MHLANGAWERDRSEWSVTIRCTTLTVSIGREGPLEVDREIAAGQYARKQLLSPLRLISWSHGARYRIGLELAAPLAGKRILDYGCGDGTFLALLCKGSTPPSFAVGAEAYESLVADCRR